MVDDVSRYLGQALPDGFDLDAQSRIAKSGVSTDGTQPETGVSASGSTVNVEVIPAEGWAGVFLDPVQYAQMLNSFKPWKRTLKMIPFITGAVPVQLLPVDDQRSYFFIVNTGGANTIFVGFDVVPNAGNSLPLFINGGNYEPLVVPSNAVSVVSPAGASTGILIYAAN